MLTNGILSQNCCRSIPPTRFTINLIEKRCQEIWKPISIHASSDAKAWNAREFQQPNYSIDFPKARNYSTTILEDNVDLHVEPTDWVTNPNDASISRSINFHVSRGRS
jgi:hypothetical protein